MARRQCTHIKDDGTQCRSFAINENGLCRIHSMTPEELSKDQRRLQARRASQIRAAKMDASDHLRGYTVQQAQRLAYVTLERAIEGTADLSEGYAAVAVLFELQGIGQVHTLTKDEIRKSLDELISKSPHRQALVPAPHGFEIRRAYRAQWFKEARRYSTVTGLYVLPLPDFMIGEGEDRETIMRNEAPDLSAWTTEEINEGAADATHVRAYGPDGSMDLIPVETAQATADKATSKRAHKLAARALELHSSLTAT